MDEDGSDGPNPETRRAGASRSSATAATIFEATRRRFDRPDREQLRWIGPDQGARGTGRAALVWPAVNVAAMTCLIGTIFVIGVRLENVIRWLAAGTLHDDARLITAGMLIYSGDAELATARVTLIAIDGFALTALPLRSHSGTRLAAP
ncbi:hypothetical protein ACVWW9_001231 [Agrococcus sp. UYP33]